jgi:hypothetical protein
MAKSAGAKLSFVPRMLFCPLLSKQALAMLVASLLVSVAIIYAIWSTTTITISEDDWGCMDKSVTRRAIRLPLHWKMNSEGKYWLPFADPFTRAGGHLGYDVFSVTSQPECTLWSAGEKAIVRERDGRLACLKRRNAGFFEKCYWTAIGRPPSRRAGPMPK